MSISVNIDWKFCFGVAGIIFATKMDSVSAKETVVRVADAVVDKIAARLSAA